jgi:hypothetical protein
MFGVKNQFHLCRAPFPYWDAGLKHKEQGRRKRLEAHRNLERGDA